MTKASDKQASKRVKEAADRGNEPPAEHGSEPTVRHNKDGSTRIPADEYGPRRRTGPQCSAHRTNGEPCKNAPIKGGSVCAKHGGSAGQVRRKAQERMLALVSPALARLEKMIRDPMTSDADAVRAMREVFNRAHAAGLSEKAALDVTVEETPWDNLIREAAEVLVAQQNEPALPTYVTVAGVRYRLEDVIDLARYQAGETPPGFDPALIEPAVEGEVVDAEWVDEPRPLGRPPIDISGRPPARYRELVDTGRIEWVG